MAYSAAENVFADADAKVALAKALFARLEPVAGTPAETYLLQTRRLPTGAVRACEDLRYLSPPIDGRPPEDHALVSLLRDGACEVSGLSLNSSQLRRPDRHRAEQAELCLARARRARRAVSRRR